MQINRLNNSPNFSALYLEKSIGERLKRIPAEAADNEMSILSNRREEFKNYKYVDVYVYETEERHPDGFGTIKTLKASVVSKENPQYKIDDFSHDGKTTDEFYIKTNIECENSLDNANNKFALEKMFHKFAYFNNYEDLDDSYNSLKSLEKCHQLPKTFEYARQVEANRQRMLDKELEESYKKTKRYNDVDKFMKDFDTFELQDK